VVRVAYSRRPLACVTRTDPCATRATGCTQPVLCQHAHGTKVQPGNPSTPHRFCQLNAAEAKAIARRNHLSIWFCQLKPAKPKPIARQNCATSSLDAGHLSPHRKGAATQDSIIDPPQQMPADAKQIAYLAVNAQKPLCLMRRFESLHSAFLFASVFMRDLGSIVGGLVLTMNNRWHHLAFCRGVASKFVRSHFKSIRTTR